MAWMDSGERALLLFSMMTLGCIGGDDVADDDDGADGTTGTTGATTGGPGNTSTDPETSADSTGNAESTTDGGTTMGVATGGTSSGTGDPPGTDSSSGSGDESTTSVEPPSPFVEACVAVYTTYQDCFGGKYSEEELLEVCSLYEDYGAMYYGEECVGLQTDYFVCLSELTCQEFDNVAPGGDNCSEIYAEGNAACPELFLFCTGGAGGGGGGDMCLVESFDCLDGNEYGVECNGMTCTCMTNGMTGVVFPSGGPDACNQDGFGAQAEMACGFPAGVFF